MSNEPEYTYPFQLIKTNHGIDSWDAKSWPVAVFSTEDKAIKYLAKRGYSYEQYGSYYHEDVKQRHTMGAISYKIKRHNPTVLIDPS